MADGASYEGAFAADKRHGLGTYTYANGDTYSGAWCSGAKHGKGLYYFAAVRSFSPPRRT